MKERENRIIQFLYGSTDYDIEPNNIAFQVVDSILSKYNQKGIIYYLSCIHDAHPAATKKQLIEYSCDRLIMDSTNNIDHIVNNIRMILKDVTDNTPLIIYIRDLSIIKNIKDQSPSKVTVAVMFERFFNWISEIVGNDTNVYMIYNNFIHTNFDYNATHSFLKADESIIGGKSPIYYSNYICRINRELIFISEDIYIRRYIHEMVVIKNSINKIDNNPVYTLYNKYDEIPDILDTLEINKITKE